jgi:hypothetical protein
MASIGAYNTTGQFIGAYTYVTPTPDVSWRTVMMPNGEVVTFEYPERQYMHPSGMVIDGGTLIQPPQASIMAQVKSFNRFVFTRIFGRIN